MKDCQFRYRHDHIGALTLVPTERRVNNLAGPELCSDDIRRINMQEHIILQPSSPGGAA